MSRTLGRQKVKRCMGIAVLRTGLIPTQCVLKHKQRYDVITLMMRNEWYISIYNKSVGTFYRAIYSMRVLYFTLSVTFVTAE